MEDSPRVASAEVLRRLVGDADVPGELLAYVGYLEDLVRRLALGARLAAEAAGGSVPPVGDWLPPGTDE